MKKGSLICLNIFSGLSILGLIFSIIFVVLFNKSYTESIYGGGYYDESKYMWAYVLTNVFNFVSTVGTFVCGIIVTSKSKHLTTGKGITKGAGITAIVGGSIGLLVAIVAAASAGGAAVGTSIVILVAFGLSIGATVKVSKGI